jgi:hypothetical protein
MMAISKNLFLTELSKFSGLTSLDNKFILSTNWHKFAQII